MGLWHIPSQCNEDVTSSIKNADYSQVSAMAWREKMTAVLLTSGQEFSKKRRNRRPKNLKQAVAGIFEGCKKSRMAGVRVEGRSPGEEAAKGVRARRPCPGELMARSLQFILKEEGSPGGLQAANITKKERFPSGPEHAVWEEPGSESFTQINQNNKSSDQTASLVRLSLCVHAQSYPNLRHPTDCSPPVSSVHGIL